MDDKLIYILEESICLFEKFGIRSVSMDDIAKALRISKKTLYKHVKNKADLIDQAVNFKMDHKCEYFAQILDKEKNAIDVLLEISKEVSKTYQESTPNMLFDMQKYYPDLYKKHMERHKKVVYEGVIQNIKFGMEQGIYRSDLNSKLLAELYVKKLKELNDNEFLNNIQFSFKKIFEVMFDNHIRAIVNEKGLMYYLDSKESLKFKV